MNSYDISSIVNVLEFWSYVTKKHTVQKSGQTAPALVGAVLTLVGAALFETKLFVLLQYSNVLKKQTKKKKHRCVSTTLVRCSECVIQSFVELSPAASVLFLFLYNVVNVFIGSDACTCVICVIRLSIMYTLLAIYTIFSLNFLTDRHRQVV